MPLSDCRLIELPSIQSATGVLGVVEGGRHAPFHIRRVFYIRDVPVNSERGGHGHRSTELLIIALQGTFEVQLDDGGDHQSFFLNSSERGLYVAPMVWHALGKFSPDALCLVLASKAFDESDYIRGYDDYLAAL